MNITLRIILIICSLFSLAFSIKKIKQAKVKVINSIIWMFGAIVLVLMAIFTKQVGIIANKLGFEASSNFVFFILIGFLLVQVFVDNIRIGVLNERIKDLNHHIALKEHEEEMNNKN